MWFGPRRPKKIGVTTNTLLSSGQETVRGVDVTFEFKWWSVTYCLPMTTARALHQALERAINSR